LARLRALLHRHLSHTARLGAVLALSGAVLFSVFLLPASASSSSGTYTVKLGDTLSRVAARQGLGSWRSLYDANPNISNPNLILVGQHLVIPSGDGSVQHRSFSGGHSSVRHQDRSSSVERTSTHVSSHSSRQSSSSSQHSSGSVASGGVWDRLAQCESGGNWSTNTGNGFYGGLQFTQSSWSAAGGGGSPQHASRSEQIRVAQNLQKMQGWGAWPTCSRKVGLR
jgi:LysM repeat protein